MKAKIIVASTEDGGFHAVDEIERKSKEEVMMFCGGMNAALQNPMLLKANNLFAFSEFNQDKWPQYKTKHSTNAIHSMIAKEIGFSLKKSKYWQIYHGPDLTESGTFQRRTYMKTTWLGHENHANFQKEIVEDWCFIHYGKKAQFVQGCAPTMGWVVSEISASDYISAIPSHFVDIIEADIEKDGVFINVRCLKADDDAATKPSPG